MIEQISLSSLRRGEVASIAQVIGDAEAIRRLHELGLQLGARIEILRSGSPCIVRVNDSTICFRHEEQVRVMVSPRMTA